MPYGEEWRGGGWGDEESMSNEPMTDEVVVRWKKKIDAMTREEMCRLWRFAPSGHPCFLTGTSVTDYFKERFDSLGGFSPGISKRIGW